MIILDIETSDPNDEDEALISYLLNDLSKTAISEGNNYPANLAGKLMAIIETASHRDHVTAVLMSDLITQSIKGLNRDN